MSRPVGSKNKSTIAKMQAANSKGGGVYNIKLEKQVEGAAVTRKSGQGWVQWGLRNTMPTLLLDLYNQSPTHRACVTFEVQSIIGNGVDLQAMKLDGSQVAPNYYQDWNTFLRAIALDYCVFGTYCIQILMNKDRKTYSFYHVPADKVRWSEYDEDGQITSYWVCNDWSMVGQYPPIQIDAFDMKEDSKIQYGKPYLYCFRPYTPCMTYYTQPVYQAGIKSIQAEIEVCNYELKSAVNSFISPGCLVLNEVETDEERQAILKNVSNLFSGGQNGGACMVSFRNNVEQLAPEYIPFSAPTGHINLFADANSRIIDHIVSSHQIASKTLIGLSNEKNGFNSEGKFLETAYCLYNTLVGNFNRDAIVKTINFMLKMNGIDQELILRPLRFTLEDDEIHPENDNNDKGSEVDEKDTKDNDSDNVEEQVTD